MVENYLKHSIQKILSVMSVNNTGILLSKIWKFFILSMACSTWILKDAMCRVTITSFSESCVFLLRYGGMLRRTPLKIRSYSISNPRSAITKSPLSNKSKIPLCLVNALSDMLPGNKDETKVIVPSGEIPMRALKVLSFL